MHNHHTKIQNDFCWCHFFPYIVVKSKQASYKKSKIKHNKLTSRQWDWMRQMVFIYRLRVFSYHSKPLEGSKRFGFCKNIYDYTVYVTLSIHIKWHLFTDSQFNRQNKRKYNKKWNISRKKQLERNEVKVKNRVSLNVFWIVFCVFKWKRLFWWNMFVC